MIKRIERDSVIIAAVILLASIYFKSPLVTLSVAIGEAMAIANFWLLAKIVTGLVVRGSSKWKVSVFQALIKMALLFVFLWLILVHTKVEAVPFVVGLSVVVVSTIYETMVGAGSPEEAAEEG